MADLASRIVAAMKEAGLSQSGLAKVASTPAAKVSQQLVQHLASGRNKSSSHLPAIAKALGVSTDWLATGRSDCGSKRRADALLIGKVGLGGQVVRRADGPVLAGVESPLHSDAPNVIEVSGDTQKPFCDGWLIFYGPEKKGVSEECLGKLCVVQVKDGPVLLRTLKPGTRKGVFRLESWNANTRIDVKITWAARVTDIRPA